MGWNLEHISDIASQPDLFSTPVALKEKLLLSLSSVRGKTIDNLAALSGESVSALNLALLEMDLEGLVRKDALGLWFKK